MANNRHSSDWEFEKYKSNRVTSVGNSWIICRSKSHSGRIYYFNTLTGEAVWNLSDEEIEKAKKTTKMYQRHGNNLDSCPEPKEPPSDIVQQCYNTHEPQQLRQDLTANHQMAKQTCIAPPYTQCVKCFSINSLTPLPLAVASNANFTPNIWSASTNSQLIFGPSESSSSSLNQTSVNLPLSNADKHSFVHNTSAPLSTRFHLMRSNNYTTDHNHRTFNKKRPNYRYNNRNSNVQKSVFFNQSDISNKPRDLRQLLFAKRNLDPDIMSGNCTVKLDEAKLNPIGCSIMNNDANHKPIQIIKPKIEDICPSDIDDIWLKEHAIVQGTQLKLNVEPLKRYVIKDISSSNWFIVADYKALLDHYNFINVLANSDGKCLLMVPENILAALQRASRSDDISIINRAHYVLWILTQQFMSGRAVMGKDSEKPQCTSLYDFALKLSEQYRNVVMISDNVKPTNYENFNILLFSIEEIKKMLESHCTDLSVKQQSSNLETTGTVPNTTSKIQTCVSHDIQCNLYLDLDEPKSNSRKRKESSSNTDIILTSDISVQTDLVADQTNIACKEVQTDTVEKIVFNKNDSQTRIVLHPSSNKLPKKKEIRLKRNTLPQPIDNTDGESNTETKQFKWRKRKRSQPDIGMHNYAIDWGDSKQTNNVLNSGHLNDSNTSHPNMISVTDDDRHVSDNSFSEHISTYSAHLNNNQHSVTIEETSTSGIISNSVSNDDTESERSIRRREGVYNNYGPKKSPTKCVMFEIESSDMQKSLITRSDEWISRFFQIMEEVLTEILQRDPPFSNITLPPPWSLHEAAECIKKKFCHDQDVMEAASRLSNILYKISDDRGKRNEPLEPSAFMEMYSYAIFLIDSLQMLLTNCEDIQIAADSLAKLLFDIQNPNNCCVSNASFDDCIEDLSAIVSHSSSVCTEDTETITNNSKNELHSSSQKQAYEVQCASSKETPEKLAVNKVKSVPQRKPVEKPATEVQTVSQNKIQQKGSVTQILPVKVQKETLEKFPTKEVQNVLQKKAQDKTSDVQKQRVIQNQTLEILPTNKSESQNRTLDKSVGNEEQSDAQNKTPVKSPYKQIQYVANEIQGILENKTPENRTYNQLQSVSQKKTPETRSENAVNQTYNLRLTQKKTIEEQVEENPQNPQNPQFIRNINIDDSFFSSCKKRLGDAKAVTDGPLYLKQSSQTNECFVVKTNDFEPKIIRKFTTWSELERDRLKLKPRELLDMDSLDYSGDKEYAHYDEDNVYGHDDYQDEHENYYEMTNNTKDIDMINKNDIKWVFARFMAEVQETFLRAYNFCKKTLEEMKVSMCSSRRLEIQVIAQKTFTHIDNVYTNLKSIHNREEKELNNNINIILNEAGFYLDYKISSDYRELIEKYAVQAKQLLESVNIIVDALK